MWKCASLVVCVSEVALHSLSFSSSSALSAATTLSCLALAATRVAQRFLPDDPAPV